MEMRVEVDPEKFRNTTNKLDVPNLNHTSKVIFIRIAIEVSMPPKPHGQAKQVSNYRKTIEKPRLTRHHIPRTTSVKYKQVHYQDPRAHYGI